MSTVYNNQKIWVWECWRRGLGYEDFKLYCRAALIDEPFISSEVFYSQCNYYEDKMIKRMKEQ